MLLQDINTWMQHAITWLRDTNFLGSFVVLITFIILRNIFQPKEIGMQHFELALRKITPSIKKGTVGLVELSPVYWSQIGGLSDVIAQIKQVQLYLYS